MKFKRLALSAVIIVVPAIAFFIVLTGMLYADNSQEPYSIHIVAGQSWAEGTNSFRSQLPAGTGIDKANHPADTVTGLWWAGADGKGPTDFFSFLDLFFNGNNPSGWIQSGGDMATGAGRLKNLNDVQRGGQFGPELSVGRELYDKGYRKVIILKVSYGFQALAKASGPTQPFDWNSEPGRNKSYQKLKTEFNSLTAYLNSIGQKYTVDGFYWSQGGTDMIQQEFADAYEQNLRDFIHRAVNDFQLHPKSAFVIGKASLNRCIDHSYPATGNYCGFPYARSLEPLAVEDLDKGHTNFAKRMRIVRNAQQKVADDNANNTENVKIFEVNDVPISSDDIHVNEQGNIIVGRRFVNMFALPYRLEGSNDYDGDGVTNAAEDTGRGPSCPLIVDGNVVNTANNGNLGDDDSDCDGFPNYIDRIVGTGSGLQQ